MRPIVQVIFALAAINCTIFAVWIVLIVRERILARREQKWLDNYVAATTTDDNEFGELIDAEPVEPYYSFLDRDHYHNMTGESDPEKIVWSHCLTEITHCPSVCDCYLDEMPCTARLIANANPL